MKDNTRRKVSPNMTIPDKRNSVSRCPTKAKKQQKKPNDNDEQKIQKNYRAETKRNSKNGPLKIVIKSFKNYIKIYYKIIT
jgi:hypothetical protein